MALNYIVSENNKLDNSRCSRIGAYITKKGETKVLYHQISEGPPHPPGGDWLSKEEKSHIRPIWPLLAKMTTVVQPAAGGNFWGFRVLLTYYFKEEFELFRAQNTSKFCACGGLISLLYHQKSSQNLLYHQISERPPHPGGGDWISEVEDESQPPFHFFLVI